MFSRFVATLGLVDAYLNRDPHVLMMENIRFILISCLLCTVFDMGLSKLSAWLRHK